MDLEVLLERDASEYIFRGLNPLFIIPSFKQGSRNVKLDDMLRLWRVLTHVQFSCPDTKQNMVSLSHFLSHKVYDGLG